MNNNSSVTVSAPGKLMLFGDHAVMYGHPCIVTAISPRLYVFEGRASGDTRFIDAAIAAWGKEGTRLAAKSDFSGVYGFGSSSAVTVAALKYLRPDASLKEIFKTAYDIVLRIQGTGSGFDVAAATIGGTLLYGDGGRILEQLPVTDIPLIVGYTGIKADTVALVQSVFKKKENEPEKVGRIFEAIGKLVVEAKDRITEGDWERVGRLMDFNQEYLRDLGVSSEKLESLISAAKKAGAWGAKLSGAGGGDCMICVAPDDKKKSVIDAISAAGGTVIDVKTGTQGVRLEERL